MPGSPDPRGGVTRLGERPAAGRRSYGNCAITHGKRDRGCYFQAPLSGGEGAKERT